MWVLKIRKSSLLRLFCILSFFLGILGGAENHYQLFRLKNLFLEGPPRYLEVLDRFLECRKLRFFPGAFFSFPEIRKDLEKRYPVDISCRYIPWRSCVIRVKPLEVFMQIYWEDALWNVAREGRAWRFSQEKESPSVPRIIWGEGLNPPVALSQISGSPGQQVCNALAPLDKIEKYIQILSGSSFLKKAPAFTVQKKGTHFQVLLEIENFLIVLDGEKPQYWVNVDKAIETLSQKLKRTSQKMRIDATYPDKIIVQELF